MRKSGVFITVMFLFIFSKHVVAQTQTGVDYFSGKWDMMVRGLPNGDTRVFILLDNKDSTLAGVIQDSTGVEISKFSKVELKDSIATVYFTAQGYDVYMIMNKKDEDHVTGNMLGMFVAEGTRAKPAK